MFSAVTADGICGVAICHPSVKWNNKPIQMLMFPVAFSGCVLGLFFCRFLIGRGREKCLVGRVQGRRTTGGQGPGKADNWRAGSREGGQLAGKVQGRRTTGGQGPGKADGQGQGKADNWRAGSRVKVCFNCFFSV